MTRLLPLLLAATLGALAAPVLAHSDANGPRAAYGGVVSEANDLQFELVLAGDGATIYLIDHGKPIASAGAGGKLTVLTTVGKSEAPLEPAGGNRLRAKGSFAGAPGTKAIASINLPGKGTVNVRFVVK